MVTTYILRHHIAMKDVGHPPFKFLCSLSLKVFLHYFIINIVSGIGKTWVHYDVQAVNTADDEICVSRKITDYFRSLIVPSK